MLGTTAVVNATGGSGSYQFRFDQESTWSFANTRASVATGTHYAYVRDLFQNDCFLSMPFRVGETTETWKVAEVLSSSATSSSITLRLQNPNVKGYVRVDYSLTNANLNDDSGKFWKFGTGVEGPATAGETQELRIQGLDPNTMYYFRVLVYGDGKKESNWNYGGGTKTATVQESLAATTLSGTLDGYTASLSWPNTSTGHFAYELQVSVSGGGFYTLDGNIAPSQTTYSHPLLSRGTKYEYKIRAKGAASNAPFSNVLSLTTGNANLKTPSLNATIAGNSVQINISDDQTPARGYEIQKRIGLGNFARANVIDQNWIAAFGRNWTDAAGLEPEVDYSYRTRALGFTEGENSGFSAAVSVRKTGSTSEPVDPGDTTPAQVTYFPVGGSQRYDAGRNDDEAGMHNGGTFVNLKVTESNGRYYLTDQAWDNWIPGLVVYPDGNQTNFTGTGLFRTMLHEGWTWKGKKWWQLNNEPVWHSEPLKNIDVTNLKGQTLMIRVLVATDGSKTVNGPFDYSNFSHNSDGSNYYNLNWKQQWVTLPN